jgi:four helix bundle protein
MVGCVVTGGYVGTINRFEDLKIWQAARKFVNQVYLITQEGNISKDYWLKDQIRRAAGSVMHNIAEGFDAGTDRYFIQFLGYARQSASEVQSQLYSALDQGYISKEQFKIIYELSSDIKRQING